VAQKTSLMVPALKSWRRVVITRFDCDTALPSYSCQLPCLQVYDIVQDDGTPLGVVRVAAPAFPKDKIESEVIDKSL